MTGIEEHQQALLTLLREFDRVCKKLDVPYILFAGTALGAVRHRGFIPWDDDVDVILLRQDYQRFLAEAEGLLGEDFFLQKEFSEHWPMFHSKLRLEGTTCLEEYHPKDPLTHQGIYMDIFPCDNGLRHPLGRRAQFLASRVVIAKCLDARGYDTGSKRKKLFMALCRPLPIKPFLRLAEMGGEGEYVHSFFGASSCFEKSVYPRRWFTHRRMMTFEDGEFPVSEEYHRLLATLYGDYMTPPTEEQREKKRHAILLDSRRSWEEYAHFRDGMTFAGERRSIR